MFPNMFSFLLPVSSHKGSGFTFRESRLDPLGLDGKGHSPALLLALVVGVVAFLPPTHQTTSIKSFCYGCMFAALGHLRCKRRPHMEDLRSKKAHEGSK